MEYSTIVAVTGMPGLFELINSRNDGALLRSPEDGKTRFVSSRIHNFSHLESIEVYTVNENVNLVKIFNAMEEKGDKTPDTKDDNAIKKYFEKVFPELDFERVYPSDLKKMVKWFETLKTYNVEIKLSEPEEEPEVEMEMATSEPEEERSKKETKKKEQVSKEEKKAEKKPAKTSKKEKEKTPAKKAAKKK